MKVFTAFLFSVILGAGQGAFAQDVDLLVVNQEGTSQADSAVEAAKEIQSKVVADTARQHVIDIVGEKRYQKSKAQIESKLIRQSAKFIPFVNPGKPEKTPDGAWKMPIEMRISLGSLRKMILDQGFLNDAEGPASILPMISFSDRRKSVSLRWWLGEEKGDAHKFLVEISNGFHEKLQAEFLRQGFHMVRPVGSQSSPLPEPFRSDRLTSGELATVAEFFSTPMILKGEVRFRESPANPGIASCSVKLQVVQPVSGRSVAEVTRGFDAEPGPFEAMVRAKMASEGREIAKDLATQVVEAWQRGTLNTNTIRVAFKGQLNPKQVAALKSGLLQSVREMKTMKERVFEPGLVQYDVDYSGEVAQLADKLKAVKLQAFDTKLAESSEKGFVLEVKAH